MIWKHKTPNSSQPGRDLIAERFDEIWYNNKYSLLNSDLKGLAHYFKFGARAGYQPNAIFDESFYISNNPDVANAVHDGTYLCGFDHYVRYGRLEGRACDPVQGHYSYLKSLFDEDWYNNTYDLSGKELHGFGHYVTVGARKGYSPNDGFDEEFYLAFYDDARKDISLRKFLCGYDHYILRGRAENRLAKHDLTRALEARHRGITYTVGVDQARAIDRQLMPLPVCSNGQQERYWILIPTLDPDIFFGGYKAFIELIFALTSLQRQITIIICDHDSDDDGAYFRYWVRRQARMASAFESVQIMSRQNLNEPLRLTPTDKIFAYSAWEAHLAHHMAAHTKSGLFAWLVQEYEPIFHDHSADHAIVTSAYRLPHYPIFNSAELKNYFQQRRLGVFSGERPPAPRRDYAVFEHVLTPLRAPTLAELQARTSRSLIFYARPEAHGKRNLFPLALIALQEMAREGGFVGSWEFHGLGALAEATIPLSRDHKLILHAKMPEAEYSAFMHNADVVLSLMYAPHPGLMTFEMASVGARVVTNVFESRSESYLRGLSENIVPCEPSVSDIKRALTEAIESLHDFSSRVRGMRIANSQFKNSWSEVFNKDFFHHEMSGFFGTDRQRAPEEAETCIEQA